VFCCLSGLFRGATHLDLAQEVFGVLPRPWTSSWTLTMRLCLLIEEEAEIIITDDE
jgi:hypothetical protein